jgi:lysophospholipase L1-like esterase
MKIFKIISIIILSLFIVFMGCTLEEPEVDKTESNTGSYDLSKYVAIGNSLTAGFQSGSLVDVHQKYSFPKLIAGQLGIGTFEQPTVSYPGMPNIMVLESLTGDVGYAEGTGAPTNSLYGAPYNNLGIPGALLNDILTAHDSLDCTQALMDAGANPAFDLVLRNPNLGGNFTVFQQAKILQPTLITMWIGNNDVLGFATSGGVSPTDPTPSTTFQFLYNQLADSIAGLGATVAVATIPNVTDIPFFTTIGPMMVAGIKAAMQADTLHQIQGLFYQMHGEFIASGLVDSTGDNAPLITLLGGSYTSLLGMPTGQWYRDLAASQGLSINQVYNPLQAQGIDSTQAFGFHPQNPWPDALTLDAGEVETAQNAITDFNGFIETAATQKGFAFFDAYTFFGDVAVNGYTPDQADLGDLTAAYISGGLFSLDGVHPSNVGYAILANEFIKAINAEFDINITEVNLRNVMGGAQAPASLAKYNINNLSNTVEVLGGKIK